MDLKTRKYINNTNGLPNYALGWQPDEMPTKSTPDRATTTITQPTTFGSFGKTTKSSSIGSRWNWDDASGQLASGAISGINTIGAISAASKPTIQPSEMLQKYGTSQGNIDGIGYTRQNYIDAGREMDIVDQQINANTLQTTSLGATTGMSLGLGAAAAGASLGGWAGPIGAAIGALGGLLGGVFAGSSRRRRERERLRKAQLEADNINEQNRSEALTTSLRQKQAEQYGDLSNQSLYSAADGSEGVNPVTNETYKKFLVQTPNGKKYAKQNAWLDAGEYVEDARTGASYKVKGNPRKTDSVRGRIDDNTRIASKRVVIDDATGATTADLFPKAKAEGWTDELFEMQKMKKGLMTAKYGRECLPGYAIGWENIAATAPGLIMSIGDLLNSKSEDVAYTNDVPHNRYERYVANLMAGRRGNLFPVTQQLLANEGAQRYRTRASGGLSAAQRAVMSAAGSMGSGLSRANALLNIQQMNNQYAKENADILNQMGTSLMTAQEQARQFNTQMNNAAHAAHIQNMQMAKRNILDYASQFAKNAWEKNQFDKMYKLYAEEQARRNRETDAVTNRNRAASIASSIWTPSEYTVSNEDFSKSWGDAYNKGIIGKPNHFTAQPTYSPDNIEVPEFPTLAQLSSTRRRKLPIYRRRYNSGL